MGVLCASFKPHEGQGKGRGGTSLGWGAGQRSHFCCKKSTKRQSEAQPGGLSMAHSLSPPLPAPPLPEKAPEGTGHLLVTENLEPAVS